MDTSLGQLHELVGSGTLQLVVHDESHSLVLDEAGMRADDQHFWKWSANPTYFAGRALLCGRDEDGKPAPATIDVDEAWTDIEWLNVKFLGMQPVDSETVTTEQGTGVRVTYMPHFEVLPDEGTPEPEKQPEKPKDAQEVPFWTITRDGKLFTAHRLLITPNGTKSSGVTLENVDLDTLRSMLPDGLHALARSPNDHPSLIETWM